MPSVSQNINTQLLAVFFQYADILVSGQPLLYPNGCPLFV